ncbi:MAG TPA: chaperonin GroEL [Wolbachia sp.]|jgi:chaperonin GroEL|uniref:chaperonin GroEL n=1 Tax=Wolbachia endosymbiont of Pentalonia nigronervosa TaxID=1301914 RepID=UPI000ED3F797|nr:chaperonin GroEL [Wolbachia endosymbiont of Pentalonia nigronervosa]MBD0390966.1 chaperonin GroEL [Wolbachia endosymbiont of Pentalonia nigronervosa]HCE59578.1 chaperonin GroEL [Wolbachia sp.]
MANIVISGEQLQNVVREVAGVVYSTVGITGGPKGLTVGISKPYGAPEVTKDGYKVMKNIKPEEPLNAAIASIFAQSCSQCNDKVGDGTTTCSVLTSKMVMEASKSIAAGSDRVGIKNGMLKAKDVILKEIASMSRTISLEKMDEVAQVAIISANGDKDIGNSIADSVKKVGKEGVITVEESKGSKELEVELTTGMQFDRGYLSPYFITNNEKMIVELDDPYLLITEKKLNIIQPLLPILEAIVKSGRPLLIIAEDIEGEALSTLVINKLRGGLKVAAVKAPGFGDRRKEMLEDIATLTGAKYVIKDELGIKMEDLTLEDLGTAKNVKITKDNTTVVSENSESEKVKSRIAQIKSQIETSTSDYDKEKLRERLAKLSGGVAVLKVGGATEVEVKERRDRVEDALHATRAAIEEGIVPGGGVALLYAASALEKLKSGSDEEQIGINIIKKILSAPIRKLVKNAGLEPAIVTDHLIKQNDKELIYNVEAMNYANAFTAGVIDPAKVVRIAFETAVSVASMLITTESMIVDVPSKDDNSSSPMGGGGMGGF